ncbi:spore germination protein [Paenibacillus baekrokdamisoli]|uniref:Spore germination protein n=1 Tax=Paenibacillus baekrokdamisoli TaxID=1712516 RepID=A0A3G9J2D4_9BACL|nr:spore germination protein [Paenibacillus baekrokdamisoli]BBH18843.1 spore germination protein [Paenibacillus baekrokdamisoli]
MKTTMTEQEKNRSSSYPELIDKDLTQTLAHLHHFFSDTPDLIIRKLHIKQTGEQAILTYLDGLTDKTSINQDVLRPLQFEAGSGIAGSELIITIGNIVPKSIWPQIEMSIFNGNSMLFVEGRTEAYSLDTRGWPQRAIEDPQLEPSLKGAHQGFLETGEQNIALIRRYIPNRELKIKRLTVGQRGHTLVSILYLEDVVNPLLLQRLEERINQINVDVIINTGELAEFIEDNPFSLFPQFISTERPDAAASQILQGRCVVVVDRSPSVLVAPVTFMSFFQSIDDYSMRWSIATFLRLLRISAFFIAVFLPAIYISIISYHYEIIPLKLLHTLGDSRGQVPFPPFVEAVLMEITLEMLREAGVRLPAPVGQTVGIVGGIVIGQAVVQAGLISNVMVIVVSFTAISSFILPNYDMVAAVRLLRFMLMALAAMFGFVGVIIGFMIMIGHLISLQSLGSPYGSPLAPVRYADWKDTLVRIPLWLMNKRPLSTTPLQYKRQGIPNKKEETE